MNLGLKFESLEDDLDLFSIQVAQIPVWERMRFRVFRNISRERGRGQAHTDSGDGVKDYLHGFRLWLKNVVRKNPYLTDEHDFLFVGHQRRKLEEDGYWWDIDRKSVV